MLAAGETSRTPHGYNRPTARSGALVSQFIFKKQGMKDSGKVIQCYSLRYVCACFLSVALHAGTGKIGHVVSCFSLILKSNSTQLFLFLQFGQRRSWCALLPSREMAFLGLQSFAVSFPVVSAQMGRAFPELFIGV